MWIFWLVWFITMMPFVNFFWYCVINGFMGLILIGLYIYCWLEDRRIRKLVEKAFINYPKCIECGKKCYDRHSQAALYKAEQEFSNDK